MCTVSFVAQDGKVIITSNRDENSLRAAAIAPKSYLINNKHILFPKDPKAGGSWFAVDQTAAVLVLLNGAQEKHQAQPLYRKSRGLLLLEMISSPDLLEFWLQIDLKDIEPFTLVFYQNNSLYQMQWNGIDKFTLSLDAQKHYIWSSATLYPKDIRAERQSWFDDFVKEKNSVSEDDMLHFHKYTKADDTQNGLVINRNEMMKTLSVTQAVIQKNKVHIRYQDLISDKNHETTFIII